MPWLFSRQGDKSTSESTEKPEIRFSVVSVSSNVSNGLGDDKRQPEGCLLRITCFALQMLILKAFEFGNSEERGLCFIFLLAPHGFYGSGAGCERPAGAPQPHRRKNRPARACACWVGLVGLPCQEAVTERSKPGARRTRSCGCSCCPC